MLDDANFLNTLHSDDLVTARGRLAALTPDERTALAGHLDQLRALIAPHDAPAGPSVRALRKAALFLWRYSDTLETAPQTAAEHLPTSEARDDALDHADHLRTNLDQVLAELAEAGEPAVEEPPYTAVLDVDKERWRLRVREPHGSERHVCDNCDGIDPASCLFNHRAVALTADLGPAENDFDPVLFGQHLVDHGYMIVPVEYQSETNLSGWTPTGEPDTYRTRCISLSHLHAPLTSPRRTG